ncbi:MAG TPA: 2-amino-4-hydroxy-6-hydroxymethyldihydropteridine diphosphokinase [Candidatus Eremiobacteraceae bacterium]|nr:2-amino-4-hydroxy-6-hydroxymethyldihydropteridine diphosphokinase [Candidatus Eremiobacteraceae bacterium]
MAIVYLALGSNVGERENNIREAIRRLASSGVEITKISSIYETEPVDYLEQPWFLNAVLEGRTALAPQQLLTNLRQIESGMGSKKPFAKGPRLIDLDILLYDDVTIETPDLWVPHPRMLQRNFVLIPLAEIAPGLGHPSWTGSAAELLQQSRDTSRVVKLK